MVVFELVFIAILFAFGIDKFVRRSVLEYDTGYHILTTILVSFNFLLCTFLLVSSALGLAMLKRAGVSRDNMIGLQKMLGVSVVLFGTTLFRTINRFMLWHGFWLFPEWYWQGLDNIMSYVLLMTALLYFVSSALYARYLIVRAPRGSKREMSQKLLLSDAEIELEDGLSVPKAYLL